MSGRWVALLRGMNVGGHRITNQALKQHFEDMGFTRVLPYQASGNVLFTSPWADPTERIEQGLQERLGYAVPTFLRSEAELRAVVDSAPFTASQLADHGKPQVMFLRGAAPAEVAASARAMSTHDDVLVLHDRELHWLPRAGVSTSELDFKALQRLLGENTVRTLGTLQRILKKLAA